MINKLFLKNQKNLNLISEKHNFYLNLTYFAAELHITMIFSPESEVAQNKINDINDVDNSFLSYKFVNNKA
jgi:hypothetical protein